MSSISGFQVREGSSIDIEGWKKFEKAVKSIPLEYKRRELLTPLRRSAIPTVKALRRQVTKHTDSGTLYDSVGTITGTSKTFPNVLVGYRVDETFRGFHGLFLEEGTEARFRKGAKGGRISTGKMPALRLVEKAAKASEQEAIRALESEMLAHTKKILAKVFI